MLCHACRQPFFEEDEEEAYFVANVIITNNLAVNGWRWIQMEDSVKPINFFYHRKCWEKVAGSEYLAERKEKKQNES